METEGTSLATKSSPSPPSKLSDPPPPINLQATFEVAKIELHNGALGTVRLAPSAEQKPAVLTSPSFAIAGLELGPQGLAQPAFVVRDQAGGGAQDVRRRAVVAFQADHVGAGKIGFEAQDVANLGAAPGIDRLIVVADATDVAVGLGQQPQQQPGGNQNLLKICGGEKRGRMIRTPVGLGVRPTQEKVREAVFDIIGPRIEGAMFYDIFAGTGAMGIEALSRGASRALFIESSRKVELVIPFQLAGLEGVRAVRRRPGAVPPVVALELEPGAQIVADLDEICAAHDVTVLSAARGMARRPSHDGPPRVVQVALTEALPGLLAQALSLSGRRFLGPTAPAAAMIELARLHGALATAGARVHRLVPGRLGATADLVVDVAGQGTT